MSWIIYFALVSPSLSLRAVCDVPRVQAGYMGQFGETDKEVVTGRLCHTLPALTTLHPSGSYGAWFYSNEHIQALTNS